MSLIRVSEVDGLVYELPLASDKSLTPITLGGQALPSIKPGQQGEVCPNTCREGQT